MTPKRVAVLRELDWLCRTPLWARSTYDAWRPYHVLYFRGQGRAGDAPSWAYEAGISLDACGRLLRALATDGLVERVEGRDVRYRMNDAGREALAEWDRGTDAG